MVNGKLFFHEAIRIYSFVFIFSIKSGDRELAERNNIHISEKMEIWTIFKKTSS
jgi:hypothetical protein